MTTIFFHQILKSKLWRIFLFKVIPSEITAFSFLVPHEILNRFILSMIINLKKKYISMIIYLMLTILKYLHTYCMWIVKYEWRKSRYTVLKFLGRNYECMWHVIPVYIIYCWFRMPTYTRPSLLQANNVMKFTFT